MFSPSGNPAAASSLPAWNLLFAREPEPDVDMDETGADMDDASADDGGGDPQGSDGDKRQNILKLVLLAVVAGAGLYVAMDPSILMGPSEEPPPAPAPAAAPKSMAAAPAPAAPAPPAPPATAAAPKPMAPSPAPQPMPAAPAAPAAVPAQPKPPMPAVAPAPAMPSPAPPKPAPAASTGNSPLFSEGQHVVVLADPAKPSGPVTLMADAGNSRPGPTVALNAAAMVLDGELRNAGWVYSVRTAQGVTGWVPEKQLQAK